MSSSEKFKVAAARVTKFAISMSHSVVILLAFWVLMDLMQSQVRIPAKSLLSPTNTNPTVAKSETPETDALVSAMHSYGYYAQKARENQQVAVKPVVPVKNVTCPVKASVVLAKAIPKPEKITKSPKVMVKHSVDARGPAPSYKRVDL